MNRTAAPPLEREPLLGLGDRRRGPRRRRTSPPTRSGTRRRRRRRGAGRASSCRCPGGPHSRSEARWPRATDRRSGPRSPTRCSWPTNSSSVRGRIRAASGCRSGGGLEQGLGTGAGDGAPGWHGAMVARAGSGRSSTTPVDVDRDVQREQDRSSRTAIRSDVLQVARDVGVLVVESGWRAPATDSSRVGGVRSCGPACGRSRPPAPRRPSAASSSAARSSSASVSPDGRGAAQRPQPAPARGRAAHRSAGAGRVGRCRERAWP